MLKKSTYAIAIMFFGAFATNNMTSFANAETINQTDKVQHIKPQDLKKMLEDGSVDLIDVRDTDEFVASHIKGAKNVPLAILDMDQLHLTKKSIVTQCKSGKRGEKAYLKLKNLNPSLDIYNLDGGIMAWEKEKLDTVVISDKLSVMRQVQIGAGTLVAAGTILGIFVAPAFFIVPIFVGCGLVFAGMTGWCGMAQLLKYMPWNK